MAANRGIQGPTRAVGRYPGETMPGLPTLRPAQLLRPHPDPPWRGGLCPRATRHAVGDPDLQGIWTNQTPVPLERPDALGDKAVFSEDGGCPVREHIVSAARSARRCRRTAQWRAEPNLARHTRREGTAAPPHVTGHRSSRREDPLHTGGTATVGRNAPPTAGAIGDRWTGRSSPPDVGAGRYCVGGVP